MSSKFAQFLDNNKIDTRRLLAVSRRIERLKPEDRAIKRSKSKAKGAAPAAAAEGAEKPKKPTSGRPITERLVEAAQAGKPIAGPAKTRLLRALNAILAQKKQDAVDIRAIF